MNTIAPNSIAIIGMAGRFPGADNLDQYWSNLINGVEGIRQFTEAELRDLEPNFETVKNDPDYVRAGGVMNDVDKFDANFFGIKPRQAKALDPQHRVWLETAWESLENAGVAPSKYDGAIGVFCGSYINSYLFYNLTPDRDAVEGFVRLQSLDSFLNMISNEKDYLPTRTAYHLDLRGPAINVQTACSTSLVAVSQACQSLLNYESDVCLAGGVAIFLPQERGYFYNEGGMLSSDGHCRPFSDGASGTVFGSGVGCVVLKRLEDAVADNDNVLAVIRGTALNNDGAHKASYTAPSVDGQADVIAMAQAVAEVTPDEISYIEAHGTATPMGDPIEVAGLTKAFRQKTDRKQFVALGAVKSSIGHLDAAAGVAGLIKTVLALKNETLPPTLHFQHANPEIDFEATPFYVVNQRQAWKRGEQARIAGISSFGVGGTNAHVIVAESPEMDASSESRSRQLIKLSAKTDSALQTHVENLAVYLGEAPSPNPSRGEGDLLLPPRGRLGGGSSLADIAHTLTFGRTDLPRRHFIVAENSAEAIEKLRSAKIAKRPPSTVNHNSPIVFLFPGQGAQYLQMGRELYETEPIFTSAVDQCAELLQPILELDIRTVIYPDEDEQTKMASTMLKQTSMAQPAIFTIEYALAKLWQSWGIEPSLMIGHSVGEYTAAVLAGVFELADALTILAARARLMQSLPSGAMVAVLLSKAELDPYLGAGVELAANNAPNVCVVSGDHEAIAAFKARTASAEFRTVDLHTSHAFHSAMMEPILDEFAAIVASVPRHAPTTSIISTLTGQPVTDETLTDPAYWVQQLRQAVRFSDALQVALETPNQIYLEVGPGSNLTQSAMKHAGASKQNLLLDSLGHVKKQAPALEALLNSVGKLWQAGFDIDWQAFYAEETRRTVQLPTYPFERQRYWVEPPPLKKHQSEKLKVESEMLDIEQPLATLHLPLSTTTMNRRNRIRETLNETLTELSGIEIDSAEFDTSFIELGYDSLTLTQVSTLFKRQLGVPIKFRRLLEDISTLNLLADYFAEKLPADQFAEEEVVKSQEPAVNSPQPAMATNGHTNGSNGHAKGANGYHPAPAQTPPAPAPQPQMPMQPMQMPQMPMQPMPMQQMPQMQMPQMGGMNPMLMQQMMMQMMMQQQMMLMSGMMQQPMVNQQMPVANYQQPVAPTPAPTSQPQQPQVNKPQAAGNKQQGAGSRKQDAHLPNAPQYNKTQKVNKKAFGPYVTVPKGEKGQLTAAQAAHLKDLTERMLAKTGGSRKLAQAYRDVHADPRGIAAFRQLWKDLVYQIAVERSKGSKVWDVDGNDYVDITMGFGINFFGHSPDFIQQAMHAQTDTGIHIGPQDTISGDVARLVREITGMQRVSFCNTGSEAVMAAIRMARTQTGRDKIVFFNGDYHGVFDEVLARPQIRKGKLHTAPAAPGITHDSVKNTYILEYGEDASLEFIRAHAHELAAVVIEPVQSRHPNNRPKQFIHNIRRITEQSGTAMVFDEVITGFRVHPRGMQHVYGVKPDICAYGKIVGGGMPIGVVAGNPKFMDGIDGGMWQYGDDSIPEADLTFFAGTFVRHPLTMAAARAVLTRIKAEGPALQERVSGRMTAFASEMNAFFVERQVPIRVNHFSSWFRFEAPADIQYKDLLFYHLLEKGVYVFTFFQNCFFSTEHSDADIERIKHAIKQGVIELQAAGFLPAPVNVVTGTFPLTDTQRDMLFESQLTDAAATAFNESFKIRLRGALHLADLQAAVQATVQRHAALHLRFSPAGDWQKLADDRQLPMALFDWSDLDSAEKQRQLSAEIDRAMTTPFDLQKGPLIRINLYKLSENEHVFQWVAHHIVYDGWSAVIIIDEIRDRYNGLVTGTKFELESADSFRDYVEWEQAISESDEGQAALIYWKTQFPQLPPALDLPTDRPHGAVKTYASQSFHYEFDASLVGKIRKAAVASKSSLFVTLLSAYKVLLHRLTTQTDIVVGTPLAGQAISDYGDLVGSCVNLLPMRTQIDSEQSFAELAKTVRGTFLDAQDNIPIPFSHIVRDLTIAQGKPPVPLVEMVFNLDRRLPTSEFHGLQQEIREVPKRSTDWKIFFNLYEEDDLLKADLEYNSDLFDQTTIHRWLTHYETLLRSISAEPAARIRDLNILSPAQRHEIVNEWNATTAPFRDQATVQQLFTEQAIRTPNATALRYKNDSISYRQLEQRSNQLANFLETKGVASGSVVGIALERSIDLVVGLLGVLKAGGTYVALDPTYPLDRLNHMAETAQAVLLLSNRASLQSIPTSREVVVLDRDWPQIAAFSDSAPKTFVTADDAMYITFTSGTTGMPKGIAGHHRGVINRCAWQWQAFPFEANEICVQKTTLNFVDSLWELWGPLLQGVELLIVADEELKDFGRFVDILASHNVHRLTLVPSLGQALLEQYPNLQTRLPKLKYWTFSGEAITRGLQERFERVLPHAVLLNFYGMSEASIDVCFYDSRHGIQAPNTPIGKPISNMQLYVLNNALNPVPVGVPGEIFVGGVGVMDSYLGLESLSAEKFLPNSFTHTGKLYRTGDIGRWMANGMLEYLGRRDQQVKLRGIRVELGEIESTLLQHPAIDQAVVVAKETAGGDKQLFAYSVLRRSKREPSSAELRDHLKATLPDYMLPTTFVTLGDLPRTPNGKVNREKLPAPMGMELPRGKTTVVLSSAARDALEFSLAQMWRSILNLPKVGINDNFFELGGHSLAAMRLFAQIHEQHEIRLPISTLFTAPTISKLADCIRETGWENEWSSLVPIQTVGNKTPFFCVGAFHINIVSLNALGQELGRPFYGLQPLGLADSAEFNLPYDQIADRYIQEIKSVQPTGPYLLGGHCSGSWLAYEVARQLESRGDKVDLLAVIGGMSPTYQEPEITGLSYYSKRLQSYWQTKDLWNVVKWETKNRLEKLQLNRVQSPQKRQQVEVISAYEQAHDTYPTQVQAGFNGNTFVMYPTEQAAINSSTPYYAWQDLTTGSLELAEIESTHGLLLRDPVVKTLGAKLREQIDASIV